MDIRIQAVIISSILTAILFFLKEYLFPRLTKSREKEEKSDQEFKVHAEPLFRASSSLFWRLNEILYDRRHDFLDKNKREISFFNYKMISTVYRVSVLFGEIKIIEE